MTAGPRWLAPLAAAATALALVVPTWLLAAPSGAPSLADGPPARTLPTPALVPWDGVHVPPELGSSVWCYPEGCRSANDDDRAITAWAHTNLVEPFLAAQAAGTPTAAPPPATATATPLPPVLTPVCTASAVVTGLTALVTARCDRATTAQVDVKVYPLPPIDTVADAQDHNREVPLGPAPVALTFQLDAPTVPGEYVVKLGVFSWRWGELYGWNDDAARLRVAAPGAPTATVAPTVPASPTPIPTASATTTATPPVAAASPSAVPATAVPTPSPAPAPAATVVCLSAEFKAGVLTCAPAA